MSERPLLYTRSKTAPQQPPGPPLARPIALPFPDLFSPIKPPHQHQTHHPLRNLTHHITRSTSCLPSPLTHSPPPKSLSWPLRRSSLASLATKSVPHLPLTTITPAHLFQRIRSSFSSLLPERREEQDPGQECEQQPKPEQKYTEVRRQEEDTWGREWESGCAIGHEEEELSGHGGFCLHLPPEVSMDTSEIEYLRRLEREALSARVGVMA